MTEHGIGASIRRETATGTGGAGSWAPA